MYILGLMTIEPMMLVQGLAAGISMIATDQMVLYKICRGKYKIPVFNSNLYR